MGRTRSAAAAAAQTAPATPAADNGAPVAPVEQAAPADIQAQAAPAKGSVTVSFQGGTREFSKEIHGADFKKVAAEFAETHKGTIA